MNTTTSALPARRAHNLADSVRIGDREREKVLTRLGQAFTQGYLSIPEYETRLDRALEAETAGALNQPLSDLAAARRGVRIHLSAYLTASLLMIAIWLALTMAVGACYFWPVWPILGGGIGIVSHAAGVRGCAHKSRAGIPRSSAARQLTPTTAAGQP